MIFSVFKIIRSAIRKVRNITTTAFYKIVIPNFGKGSLIFYNFYCPRVNNLFIGKNCLIDVNVSFTSEFKNSKLVLGNRVKVNAGVTLDFSGGLSVGDNVVFSRDTYVITHSHGYDPNSYPTPRPLKIGSNVWIGSKVIICENVSEIGDNSLIASGSVVTKNVERNSIVGGNPAKVIKFK